MGPYPLSLNYGLCADSVLCCVTLLNPSAFNRQFQTYGHTDGTKLVWVDPNKNEQDSYLWYQWSEVAGFHSGQYTSCTYVKV